jgi:hypothetical protein
MLSEMTVHLGRIRGRPLQEAAHCLLYYLFNDDKLAVGVGLQWDLMTQVEEWVNRNSESMVIWDHRFLEGHENIYGYKKAIKKMAEAYSKKKVNPRYYGVIKLRDICAKNTQ